MSLHRSLRVIGLAVFALGLLRPGAGAETRPPGPESAWQINLLGMVLRQTGESFAIIQDPQTGKTEFYPLGSDVKGARLSRILSDRIVLTVGGSKLVLRLGVAGGRSSEGSEDTSVSPAGDRQVAAGSRRSLAFGSAREAPGGSRGSSPIAAPGDSDGSDSRPAGTPGGTSTAEPEAGAATGGPSAQLRISGFPHDGVLKQQTQFAAADLRDLHLDVDYVQVSGAHRQRIELFAPDGTLYQRRFRDVTVTEGQPVNTRVPVGGTWITDHSLFGSWRVVVYLDTSQTPIASGAFALNP
jgi:Type II secretion system protein C